MSWFESGGRNSMGIVRSRSANNTPAFGRMSFVLLSKKSFVELCSTFARRGLTSDNRCRHFEPAPIWSPTSKPWSDGSIIRRRRCRTGRILNGFQTAQGGMEVAMKFLMLLERVAFDHSGDVVAKMA
jgi:hypothetical protein